MGDWDYYCALCGGPFTTHIGDGDEEDDFDPAIIAEGDPRLEWLERFRVVGEMPEDFGTEKEEAWISGPARADEWAVARVTAAEGDQVHGDREGDMGMYMTDWSDPLGFPFHDDCYKLWKRHISPHEQNIHVFHETLKSLNNDRNALRINYGAVSCVEEQYWFGRRGYEWSVFPPFHIPELQEYLGDLPLCDGSETGEPRYLKPLTKLDCFSMLAPEIMFHIMSSLGLEDMMNLQLASRTALNTVLGNTFWKKRILSEMQWVFEISESSLPSPDVDWKEVYMRLAVASRPYSTSVMRGLANRRRIWEMVLPAIKNVYVRDLKTKKAAQDEEPVLLKNAKCTALVQLIHPEPRDACASTMALMHSTRFFSLVKVEILVFFNNYNEICSVGARNDLHPGVNTEIDPGPDDEAARVESVSIPPQDWVTGLIVTTQEKTDSSQDDGTQRRVVGLEVLFGRGKPKPVGFTEGGDKRLIYKPSNRFIVGFKVQTSRKDHLLCRIGLLHEAVQAAHTGRDRITELHKPPGLNTARFLWRSELPPPDIRAAGIEHGYETYNAPLQALVFGTTDEELADVTSIKADVQFGGFEVTYGHHPSRSIGTKHQAMKTIDIDGKGGERVVTFHTHCAHTAVSARFVTNRGRQLIIGPLYDKEDRHPNAEQGKDLPLIAGIFGTWCQGGSPKTSLDRIGCLLGPKIEGHTLASMPEPSRQVGGFCWDPLPPPSSLITQGPIVGAHEQGTTETTRSNEVPKDTKIMQWLDCSRPVSRVNITLCHNMGTNLIPLSAMAFEYADGCGEKAVIGPNEFPPPPTDTEGKSGFHFCWCKLAGQMDRSELEGHPHYMHHRWDVGGRRLKTLRLWMAERPASFESKDRTLAAMQLIAESGLESDIWRPWGHTGDGDEIREIKFVGGDGEAVALKFFLGDNNRPVTLQDTTVQAIQALVNKQSAT